jgi:protease-4
MLLSSVWDKMLTDIGANRGLTIGAINEMADSMSIHSAELAQSHKLVDSLLYPDEVMDKMRTKLGINAKQDISFIGLDDYRQTFYEPYSSASKIAVIYASGDIVQGNGTDEEIGSNRMSKAIREARLDPAVKAIVLRVNSPGGDALASDIMWREIDLAKKAKPVVVSMGDYAASGGYYIACDANTIVAEPTTITGSIGVFGLIPNAQQLLNDKLGITVDTVSTNTHAAAGSVFYPLQSNEMAVLQGGVENFYHTFLSRVAAGRNMTVANVDSIAQGRVWSGAQAIKIGLVDTLGDMDVALKIAAKKANITTYSVEELPSASNAWKRFLARFNPEDMDNKILQDKLGDFYAPVQELTKAATTKGIQARMPYQLIIQ